MSEGRAVATAGINIALVKYWGKRDERLNLPESGSLSLTLAELGTRTAVRFDKTLTVDHVTLDGALAPAALAKRVSRFVDLVRTLAGIDTRAEVASESSVPVGAGLASSASSFAALAAAAARAAGLRPVHSVLSGLARRGSGSAARSIFGGLVEMARGAADDGSDAVAHPVLDVAECEEWGLRVVVADTGAGAKEVGSTEGMRRTATTSPFHASFIAAQEADLKAAREAIARRDLTALGELAEANALRMHADALAARPALLYWSGTTVAALHRVFALRKEGLGVWATIDAGPHLKALCKKADAAHVAEALALVPGIARTRTLRPGPGVEIVESVGGLW